MPTDNGQLPSLAAHSAGALAPTQVVARIYFRTKEFVLDEQDKRELTSLCKAVEADLKGSGDSAIFVPVGHADARGDEADNLQLSRHRAFEVAKFVKDKLPRAIVFLGGYGELLEEQQKSKQTVERLAQGRRVDVFYYRTLGFSDDRSIVAPSVTEIAKDSARIVRARTGRHPNETRRLLCYLKKAQEPVTARNDKYWRFTDIESCERLAYPGGRFSTAGMHDAATALRGMSMSIRQFLRTEVSLAGTDDDKFRRLLELDRDIYTGYSRTIGRLCFAYFGGEKSMPYFAAVKNTLLELIQDKSTLYSCIEFRSSIVD